MKLYFYSQGIIVTRRVRQLLAVGIFVFLGALAKKAFDHGGSVILNAELIFAATFTLTYYRELRRALYEPNSMVMKVWNYIEALLFVICLALYCNHAFYNRYNFNLFYGYLSCAGIGLYLGLIAGECLWHNSFLKQLDEAKRKRYWVNYRDNLLG